MWKRVQSKIFFFEAMVLLLGCSSFYSVAQQFTENIVLPTVMAGSNVSEFHADVDHSIHVFGLGSKYSYTDWNETGTMVPYYLKLNADRIPTVFVVPDTGHYYSEFYDWEQDLFSVHGVATDSGAVVFYSKQHRSGSDTPPAYYSAPTVTAVRFGSRSSDVRTLFKDSTGSNPQILRDVNGNIHYMWERHRQLPNLALNTYADSYESAIYYARENVDGVRLAPQFVDSGYSPQFRISENNQMDIIWFSADSSRSNTFALKYVQFSNGVIPHPVSAETIYVGEQSWLYSFEVNKSGSVAHIGWQRPATKGAGAFFSLRIADGVKTLDSLVLPDSVYLNDFNFVFNSNTGTIKATWVTRDRPEIYFASMDNGALFSNIQKLNALNIGNAVAYFLNPSNDHLTMVSESLDRLYQLDDLESHSDSDTVAIQPFQRRVGALAIGSDMDVYVFPDFYDTYRTVTRFTQRFLPAEQPPQVINAFRLSQNYPNPFNPTTTIGYILPFESSVTITLFNILGENVRVLQSSIESAGEHQVRMDGSGLSSGVYFYRLEATSVSHPVQTFHETRRMLLVK